MTSHLLTTTQWTSVTAVSLLRSLIESGSRFGHHSSSVAKHILIESVSADPNGPITLNHARNGVIGDTLASLFTFAGHSVTREFYVNDATSSRQIQRFARAVLHRYRTLLIESGAEVGLASSLEISDYPEEYVTDIARGLIERVGDRFLTMPEAEAISAAQRETASLIRAEQEKILAALGCRFDNWFPESGLHQRGAVTRILDRLRDGGHTYEQAGALWLRTTAFGDESDRTLVRPDGTPTYLAGDLTYHADKFERGYDQLIDIWNSDHATYIDRTRAGLAALGYDPTRLTIVLHAPVRLLKDGTEVRGTPLSGPDGGITLSETLLEIPADLMRLLLLHRPAEKLLDLDADLVFRSDRSNAVVYLRSALQSCHAEQTGTELKEEVAPLIECLMSFPDEVLAATTSHAPDRILEYGLGIADRWNSFRERGSAFPLLAEATATVLTNTLDILGVSQTGMTE